MRLLIAALAATALVACYSPVSVTECSVRCTAPDGPCPEGTACGTDGFCHGSAEEPSCPGPDPDPDPDAGADPGAAMHGLAAGRGFTCGLDAGDQLWCWGSNAYGQIGVGSAALQVPVPAKITAGDVGSWRKVAAGRFHACAIDDVGELWCWGADASGQLGDGDPESEPAERPQPVAEPGPWDDVALGASHTCALKQGRLFCWGRNYGGEVGNPDAGTVVHAPAEVAGGFTDWIAVDVGAGSTCGIRRAAADELYCWGAGPVLGRDPPVSSSVTPLLVDHPIDGRIWTHVAVGNNFACGIDDDANLYCWGWYVVHDEISYTPALVDIEHDWTAVVAGNSHACALAGTELHCWGLADNGETGRREAYTELGPPIDGAWSEVTAGEAHTCGIRAGEAFCFGDNGDGELGGGGAGDAYAPQLVAEGTTWSEIAAGDRLTCGIAVGGALQCWGVDDDEVLGPAGDVLAPAPIGVAGLSGPTWEHIAVDRTHACATTTAGALWCWGRGDESQLGGGDTASHAAREVPVVAPATRWQDVGVGRGFTCARDNAVGLFCWGRNDQNRVGDPQHLGSAIGAPFQVAGGIAGLVVAEAHACAISSADASLACWGWNLDNAVDERDADVGVAPPRAVQPGGDDATWLAADVSSDLQPHSCGVTTAGDLFCWGAGDSGRLGTGDSLDHATPTRVAMGGWEAVATGGPMSCGLRDGGELWCWGRGAIGARGDGTQVDAPSPVRVGDRLGWRQVVAGRGHICAIDADRALWCWGDDSSLQLGVGLGMSPTPVAVRLGDT